MKISTNYQCPHNIKHQLPSNNKQYAKAPTFCGEDLKEGLYATALGVLVTTPFAVANFVNAYFQQKENQENKTVDTIMPGECLKTTSGTTYQPEISEFYSASVEPKSFEDETFIANMPTSDKPFLQDSVRANEVTNIIAHDEIENIDIRNTIVDETLSQIDSLEDVIDAKSEIIDAKLKILYQQLNDLNLKQAKVDSITKILESQNIDVEKDFAEYKELLDLISKKNIDTDKKLNVEKFVEIYNNSVDENLQINNASPETEPNLNSSKTFDKECPLIKTRKSEKEINKEISTFVQDSSQYQINSRQDNKYQVKQTPKNKKEIDDKKTRKTSIQDMAYQSWLTWWILNMLKK